MTKIVPFIRAADTAAGQGMASFLDEHALLEFSPGSAGSSVSLDGRKRPQIIVSDWSNQELADLYRAFSIVQAAQPNLEADRGITDEGDPWFSISNAQGDVFLHICRINGEYILDSITLGHVLRANDFSALVNGFLARAVEAQKPGTGNVVQLKPGGKVFLHPSMMLAALVWTLLQDLDELELPVTTRHEAAAPDDDGVCEGTSGPVLASSGDGKAEIKAHPVGPESDGVESSDKSLHFTSISVAQALTAVAVASGLYMSAKSLDALWMLTDAERETAFVSGASVNLEGADNGELSGDHHPVLSGDLAGAIALLEAVTEFVSQVAMSATPTVLAERASLDGVEAPGANAFGTVGELVDRFFSDSKLYVEDDGNSYLEAGSHAGQGNLEELPVLQRNEDGAVQVDTIKLATVDPVQAFVSLLAEVSENITVYNALSFEESAVQVSDVGRELISDILAQPEDTIDFVSLTPEEPVGTSSSLQQPMLHYDLFDSHAQVFIDNLIQSADLEILVFQREIILLDKAALSGNATSLSWQFEDGAVISVIGLSSDLAEFLAA